MTDTQWLDTTQAAERLGVRPATLYAYVSRGQLRRRTAPDGRRSEYHPDDVAALAVRGRRARPLRPSDVVVPSAVTAVTPAGPAYRGRPAVALAGVQSFEEVAALLWGTEVTVPWIAPDPLLTAARVASSTLPVATEPAARLPSLVAAAALADPLRGDLRPSAVIRVGRDLLAVVVDSLLPDGGGRRPPADPRVAARLTAAVAGEPLDGLTRLVDAALVLLADHELAASTLAARIAASARCDPWAVVLTGLGVLSGPRHGAASRPLERVLTEVADGADPAAALAAHQGGDRHVPGFGHPLYPDGDPRARRLLELLRQGPGAPSIEALEIVLTAAARHGLPPPNVDAALAGITHAAGAAVGTGELLFAVARSVGWLAHALEQYAEPQLLRPRAVYTGPPPPG